MNQNGKFITFEGIEGGGKSTQIPLMSEWLSKKGISNIITREPGGTALSEKIRSLLLHEAMSSETELLLMFAARKEHIDHVINKHLSQGIWVLCDRFTESTYAYQAFGREMSLNNIEFLENWIQGALRPDKTFWFDLPVVEGLKRAKNRGESDRFEVEDVIFFDKVAKGYEYLQKVRHNQIVRIDAAQPIDQVTDILQKELTAIING